MSKRVLVMAVLAFGFATLSARPASAENRLHAFRLASEIDSDRAIPTSSTKHSVLSLELLVPISLRSKIFAGLGPRAFTQSLLTSTVPELLAVGVTSSFRAEF